MLYLLGETLVGRRAERILARAERLRRQTGRPVKLVARGLAAIPAAHAVAAKPSLFAAVEWIEPPPSWREQIMTGAQATYSDGVTGALRFYDWIELRPM